MTTINTQQPDDELLNPGKFPIILKVLVFMVVMVLLFTAITHLLPQVKGEVPKDIKVDLGALTMETYIAMGETLFRGKGTCTLCHNNLGRAPDILALNMEETAAERISAADYQGEAKDSEYYFHESMVEPSKYVVPGYGKAGEPSPMPAINKAPIGLSEVEMGAIIAFLQAKDGGEATIALPSEAPVATEPVSAAPQAAATAEEVLTKNGCTACHAVLDSTAAIGPELHTIGNRASREAIRNSIINPAEVIAEGYPPIMPADFADKMMVKELEMVVDFLVASKTAVAADTTAEQTTGTSAKTEKKGE